MKMAPRCPIKINFYKYDRKFSRFLSSNRSFITINRKCFASVSKLRMPSLLAAVNTIMVLMASLTATKGAFLPVKCFWQKLFSADGNCHSLRSAQIVDPDQSTCVTKPCFPIIFLYKFDESINIPNVALATPFNSKPSKKKTLWLLNSIIHSSINKLKDIYVKLRTWMTSFGFA